MSDAEMIYSALLRTERRLEERYRAELRDYGWVNPAAMVRRCICRETFNSIRTLREEIGNGMAKGAGWISHPPPREEAPPRLPPEYAWMAEESNRRRWPWAVVIIAAAVLCALLGTVIFRWSNT